MIIFTCLTAPISGLLWNIAFSGFLSSVPPISASIDLCKVSASARLDELYILLFLWRKKKVWEEHEQNHQMNIRDGVQFYIWRPPMTQPGFGSSYHMISQTRSQLPTHHRESKGEEPITHPSCIWSSLLVCELVYTLEQASLAWEMYSKTTEWTS